jgi:hypothetical protein
LARSVFRFLQRLDFVGHRSGIYAYGGLASPSSCLKI